jgi:hypothetical protein
MTLKARTHKAMERQGPRSELLSEEFRSNDHPASSELLSTLVHRKDPGIISFGHGATEESLWFDLCSRSPN